MWPYPNDKESTITQKDENMLFTNSVVQVYLESIPKQIIALQEQIKSSQSELVSHENFQSVYSLLKMK